MAINKILQGLVKITESGEYTFSLSNNGMRVQNEQAITNVEEVYIIVENENPLEVVINLPKISDFNRGWNTKIYIVNKVKNLIILQTLVPTTIGEIQDSIYDWGTNSLNVSNRTSQWLHIVENNLWYLSI